MDEQARGIRALEAVGGLLSAGVLVTAVLLAVLEVAAPAFMTGSGLTVAAGPRWDRILVPLIVGVAGELARRYRHHIAPRWRAALAVMVVLLCVAALWWGWWR